MSQPWTENEFTEAAAAASWRASEVLQKSIEEAYSKLTDEQRAWYAQGDPNRLARLLLCSVAGDALREEFGFEAMFGKRELQILLGKRD